MGKRKMLDKKLAPFKVWQLIEELEKYDSDNDVYISY
jgi:hypothetical protein